MIGGKLASVNVYLALGSTDMRKSINGLSLLVEEQFELDLFTGNLFAFCNRRRDMVKILYWDVNGFCVWMKRLEADCFRWPDSEQDVMEVNGSALSWLLHGLDLRQAHRPLTFETVA
jgi:transposase